MAVHEFPVALDDHPTRTRLLDADTWSGMIVGIFFSLLFD